MSAQFKCVLGISDGLPTACSTEYSATLVLHPNQPTLDRVCNIHESVGGIRIFCTAAERNRDDFCFGIQTLGTLLYVSTTTHWECAHLAWAGLTSCHVGADEACACAQSDDVHRCKWDDNIQEFTLLGRSPDNEFVELQYWRSKFPRPLAHREYVFAKQVRELPHLSRFGVDCTSTYRYDTRFKRRCISGERPRFCSGAFFFSRHQTCFAGRALLATRRVVTMEYTEFES